MTVAMELRTLHKTKSGPVNGMEESLGLTCDNITTLVTSLLASSWCAHAITTLTSLIAHNTRWLSRKWLLVDVVSHLVLQVHLGPTRQEFSYNFSPTTETGPHEGSITILRNTMRQDSNYHMWCNSHRNKMKGVYLLWGSQWLVLLIYI